MQLISQLKQDQQVEFRKETEKLRGEIKKTLVDSYQKGCVVKMNWSSTVDAEFMSETLECYTVDEVFMQLKASGNVGDQFSKPFEIEESQNVLCSERLFNKTDFGWAIVLRKWHANHNNGMEFRCYIRDGTLLAIVQKDDTAHYEFLASSNQELLGKIF